MNKLSFNELKTFLDKKHDQYNCPEFVETDPIQIPHLFAQTEDIEIAAFLTATMAWGQRKAIIKSAKNLMHLMDNSPFDFVCNAEKADIVRLRAFVHRTLNAEDITFFVRSLKNIYQNHNGLRGVFENNFQRTGTIRETLLNFRTIFLDEKLSPDVHVGKHISDVAKKSAAKRLNLFLMWLVRNDRRGVHLGIWDKIPTSKLLIPLDLHCGNISRKLELLRRKQNDWLAVEELTGALRNFAPEDPVRYDFALFGLGVFEHF